MPKSWLSRLFNNGRGTTKNVETNNRDSLFNLPLYPPPPQYQGKRNIASAQLSAITNEAIAAFSVKDAQQQLTEVSEAEWLKRGEQRALALFRAAAEHVPAYKDFLKKHKVDSQSIRTISDFKHLPIINKANYLSKYSLNQLSWYGNVSSSQIISFSSGSSGTPFFWPRAQILEAKTALEHELFLTTMFKVDQVKTLFINCFSMGMYVAGVITLNSLLRLGQKGYPVTIMTPGIDMGDIVKLVPRLQDEFEQIIIAGYPPFVKDVLDEGIKLGISWDKLPLKFLLAGEGYSEEWRKYIAKLVGNRDPIEDFINLYGSADAAILGHETPTTIIARSRLARDKQARHRLFGQEKLPSLLQYHPEHNLFEEVDSELVFTATGGIPLIRYNIHDTGGVLSQQQITDTMPALREYFAELAAQKKLWQLPFLYVYGKSDDTIMLYGLNIYPDNIKAALEAPQIRDLVTGRFVMFAEYRDNMNQYLSIAIELAADVEPTEVTHEDIREAVIRTLTKLNHEYRKLLKSIGAKAKPEIRLYKQGSNDLFNRAGKQKWIQNNTPAEDNDKK